MLFDPPAALRYDPSVEHLEKDEEETGRAIDETMRRIRETTFRDERHALRSVHAKAHGIVTGELEVFADLPPSLAQGLFARPARYPVLMRFSTSPGDLLPDDVSSPRGVAIKVIGVEGERLEGSEGEVTQDFVLVNGPTFSAPNAKVFLANLKLLAATTDKAEGLKKVVSAALRGAETLFEGVTGDKNPILSALGGQRETHILGDSFYSQAPLRYGDHVAKIEVSPASDSLRALTDKPITIDGKHPDGIREAVNAYFCEQGGEWDVRVQLCTDLHDMPIENAAKTWDADRSPYLTVGRITVPPQTGWSEARSKIVDDTMSFSPWRGIAAHRPLGSIMRVRRMAYAHSAAFRAEKGAPHVEPREAVAFPD